jgi:MFS family permease
LEKLKIRAGIMAASSLNMSPVGLVGIIPMAIAYYGTGDTFMQTVFVLPTLTSIPMALLVGSLANKTGKKIPLAAGIACILFSGLAPVFFDLPLGLFIAVMAVMGLGIGCTLTLTPALIASHFKGEEQAKVLAHQSAFVNMGGMVLAFAGGLLLTGGWRGVFWIYALALPVLIAVLLFLPKETTEKDASKPAVKIRLNRDTFVLCVFIFVLGLAFGIRNTNAGLLVIERGLGGVNLANYATSAMTALGIVIGFTYGMIAKKLKKHVLTWAVAAIVASMLFMGNAGAAWVFIAGNVLAGMGFAAAMPVLLSRTAQTVDAGSSTFALSVLMATNCVALFVAPAVVNTLAGLVAQDIAQVRFNVGAALNALVCVAAWFYIRKE